MTNNAKLKVLYKLALSPKPQWSKIVAIFPEFVEVRREGGPMIGFMAWPLILNVEK